MWVAWCFRERLKKDLVKRQIRNTSILMRGSYEAEFTEILWENKTDLTTPSLRSDSELCYQEQRTSRTVSVGLILRKIKYRKQTELYKCVLSFRVSNNASVFAFLIAVLIKLFKSQRVGIPLYVQIPQRTSRIGFPSRLDFNSEFTVRSIFSSIITEWKRLMCHHNAHPPWRLVIEIEVALMEDINQISILIGERDIADPSDGYDGHDRRERESETFLH
jgi:hypothetical protein